MLRNFGWVQAGALAGMAWPEEDAWPLLKAEGIGAVLSLTTRPPPGDPAAAGLVALHVPVTDFGVPTRAQLDRCLAFLDDQIEQGRPVVVHCRAGQGRTGTIVAAWLVRHGMPAEEAIARVRSLRPGSLETRDQVQLVHALGRRRSDPNATVEEHP